MMNINNLIPTFERSPFEPLHTYFVHEGTLFSKHLVQWLFYRPKPGTDEKPESVIETTKKVYGPLGVTESMNEFISILDSDILPALMSNVKFLMPDDSNLGYRVFDMRACISENTFQTEFVASVKNLADQISEGKYDAEIDFDTLRKDTYPFCIQTSLYVFKRGNSHLEELYSEELKAYHNHDGKTLFNFTADLFVNKRGFKDRDPEENKGEFKLLETVYATQQNQTK